MRIINGMTHRVEDEFVIELKLKERKGFCLGNIEI